MLIALKNIIPSPLADLDHKDSDLWGRDFSFLPGKTYQVSAPSGTGKTSLISILYGLRKDYGGELSFNDKNCRTYSAAKWQEMRKTNLSIVPQGLWIFDELSALENIQLKNNLTGHLTEDSIQHMLEKAGMAEHQHKKAKILSFGQKQRIAIIRALSQPFDFLLMDEAFSHLDQENKHIMWELIQNKTKEQNAGIILTSLGNDNLNTDKKLGL